MYTIMYKLCFSFKKPSSFIDWDKILYATQHKTSYFRDARCSISPGQYQENTNQQKQQT